MRTDEEINAEVEKLTEMKPKVVRMTAFGDDNHESIDAQIELLKERMDEDAMCERTQYEDDIEENGRDDSKWSPHAGDIARQALDWMNGDSDESPSSDWEPLVKN